MPMWWRMSVDPRDLTFPSLTRDWYLLAGAVLTIPLAYSAVAAPWLTAGAVLGALLLTVMLISPLAVLAVMLVLGPADLSFVTGGFKSLLVGAGGLDMNGIRLVGVSAGFLVLALFQPTILKAAFGRQGRFYLVFLVWATVTLLTSYSPNEGLRLLLKLAYPFLVFSVVMGMVQTREQLDRIVLCVIASGALIAIVVNPLFVLAGTAAIDVTGVRRVRGFGTHENPFSFYLLIIFLISYVRFITRVQWRYVGLCLLLAFWIALTVTRITMAAAFVSVILIALLHALAEKRYRGLLAGLALIGLLGVVLLPPVLERSLGFVPTPGELFVLVRDPAALYEKINWQGRQVLWPIVFGAFMQDPWTGLGLGSSTVVVRERFPAEAAQVVHNEYLRLATDTGIVGVVLFFLAIAAWLIAVTRSALAGSHAVRELALPAIGGIAAWAMISITDNAFDYYSPFTQYVGFLCGAALTRWRLEQFEQSEHAGTNVAVRS